MILNCHYGYYFEWFCKTNRNLVNMASILINGISAKFGGGKSILVNFLALLNKSNKKEQFIVIVPPGLEYLVYSKENIRIIPVKSSYLSLFGFYFLKIRKIVKKYKVSIIFNLADTIVPISTKQVYLFDWPYAIYPNSIAWKRMSRKEWFFRKVKLFLLKRFIHLPVLLIAQTKVTEDRLKAFFFINNIEVVPNAVSLDNLSGGRYRDFNLPKERIKLLYLTKYYSHKNIEIFLSLGRIIREEELPYNIIITISESQNINAKRFLENLKKEELNKIVINVGPVEMEYVPSLYQQSDALLMPSLLESFSGTYVEAMYHGKPIFTSDLDFAKVVCGDAAFYFNPLEANSIINSIRFAYKNPELMLSKIASGKERLNDFLSWEQVFDKFSEIIERCQ
jgi:glycosyltransferase involved in cell wall biosynthesis